jgi:1-acyl-sn-glycerol-3-phosphate acyltransferase
MLLIGCFVRKEIISDFKPDPHKTYIIVSNHSSYLDIAALAVALPLDLNYIGKIQLQKIPLFGIFFRTIDIAVDRRNAIQSATAFKKANQQLKSGVRSIVVFPEGGIKPCAPKLAPFKDGPFKMAVENQLEIIPVTMPDNYKRLAPNADGAWPGSMRIYIHQPIVTKGLMPEDIHSLRAQVFEIIQSKLEK